MFIIEAHQFLMIICYVNGQIYYQQDLCLVFIIASHNVMLKLTTCPNINRFPIGLLLQHLRGEVARGAGKT